MVSAPVGATSGPTLVKDINPSGASNPTYLTAVGSTLFFAANDGVHGNELWKSDGTAAGTKMVKNIRPYGKSSDPDNLVNVNGTLFFTAIDGVHGRELWKSDGTKAGTVMVKDLNTGKKNSFGGNSTYLHEGGAFAVGSRLFFIVDLCCVGTSALYVSDGTSNGTVRLDDGEEPISVADEFSSGAAGGRFYFVVVDKSGEDWMSQLWMSDGTTAGTHLVPGSPEWYQMQILPNNGTKLYFYTDRLWRTDGTAAGTFPISDIGAAAGGFRPMQSVLLNQRLYFGDVGLWKTDGTFAGTKPISNGDVFGLTRAGDRLFFTRNSSLWQSDGTAGGTRAIRDFATWWPTYLVAVGDKVCFARFNWTGTWSLWRSDGTNAGTQKAHSFVGPDDIGWSGAAVGGRLFFGADDGAAGNELWSYTP
ncbi:MAG: ELWxxDGT repeat protein [Chloroflexota bacterium]